MTDTPTLADIIRRLDGDGTPGPWRAQDFEDFPGDEGTPILGGGEEGSMSEHLIAYAPTLGRTPDADHLLDETQCNADAALIVALRNHADEIADALEAVERVRDYLALDMHDGECHSLRPHFAAIGPEVCNCTHGNVRRALGGER